MASITFILQEPYKKSESTEPSLRKKENAEVAEKIKKRKEGKKSIENLLNPYETQIYMFFTVDRTHRAKIKTGKKIYPKHWDFKNQKAKPSMQESIELNAILQSLKSDVQKLEIRLSLDNPGISFSAIVKEIRKAQLKKFTPQNAKSNFNMYLEQYINDIANKRRLTKDGKKFSNGTLKNYKGLLSQFNNFQGEMKRTYSYDDFDMDFYSDYVNFFVRRNYAPNTIGKHIKNLKTVLRDAREEGLHSNIEIEKRAFKPLKEDSQNIYLTEDELKRMYELNLSKNKPLEHARDIFILGVRTAQRFGDYSKFGKEHIRKIGEKSILHIKQEKTGNEVDIPMHPQTIAVLEKYSYNLPKVYEQKVNERIKIVGKMAQIEDDVMVEQTKGGNKIRSFHKKYELIKTHTARRTGATLMYLQGIPTLGIMKVTGHTTEREFLKYIKVTKEQAALSLSKHKYFN